MDTARTHIRMKPWVRAVVFVAVLGAFALIPLPLCPVRLLLRIPCPGCGATRSVEYALKGDWHASLLIHPLGVVSALIVVPSVAYAAMRIARNQLTHAYPTWFRVLWHVLVIALYLLWILRFFGLFGGPAPI